MVLLRMSKQAVANVATACADVLRLELDASGSVEQDRFFDLSDCLRHIYIAGARFDTVEYGTATPNAVPFVEHL